MADKDADNTYYSAGSEEAAQVTPLTLRRLDKVSLDLQNGFVEENRFVRHEKFLDGFVDFTPTCSSNKT